MLPAQQSLVAGFGLARDVDQRLEELAQLTPAHGMAQIARRGVAFVELGIHPGFEHFPGPAPVGLGCAQRNVGIALQLRLLVGVGRGQRDAQANRAGQFMVMDQQRLVHRCDQQFGQPHCMIASIAAADHDRKFIAAQPRHDRLGAAQATGLNFGAQSRRKLAQKLVAHRVAVHVVDTFEIIDVHQEQGDVFAVLMMAEQRGQRLIELTAVGQPGQGIEMGHVLGPLLGLAVLGHAGDYPPYVIPSPELLGRPLSDHHLRSRSPGPSSATTTERSGRAAAKAGLISEVCALAGLYRGRVNRLDPVP